MGTRPKKTLLTNLELEVMHPIWEAEGAALTVREVLAALNAGRDRPLAYNTVQTILTILREKRVVEVGRGAGRAHTYSARLSRDNVTTHMVGDLIERLFDGRVQPLFQHLVQREGLSREELESLKSLIENHLDEPEVDA